MKVCIFCGKHYKKGNKFSCNACSKALNRYRRKYKCVEYKGGKCELCGYSKSIDALHFHHRDMNEKEFNISETNSWGISGFLWEKTKKELDKCCLVCANCHAEEHENVERNAHIYQFLKEESAFVKKDFTKINYSTLSPIEQSFYRKAKKVYGKDKDCRTQTQCEYCCLYFLADNHSRTFCSKSCFCKNQQAKGIWNNSETKISWPSDTEMRELVWEKPVSELSVELGVSDVAIHKRCKHNNIEKPPRGYWTRKNKHSDLYNLKKEEIEKLVWEKPTNTIAKDFNVSPSCISDLCKKYKIQKPGVGYWRKKETGKL